MVVVSAPIFPNKCSRERNVLNDMDTRSKHTYILTGVYILQNTLARRMGKKLCRGKKLENEAVRNKMKKKRRKMAAGEKI